MTQTPTTDAPQTATSQKWLQCNGRHLQKLAHAGLTWLDQHHQHVNALNVFPVPDGDTGTNMLLTMRSAYGRIKNSDDLHVGKMAEDLAHGALMGARGNSGVILSQIWRGLAKALKGKETFNTADLAAAFQEASDTAYGGVMKPVEGTILTVVREGASEAADAAKKSLDLRFMLERVLERCKQALERTPEQLDILKQAGVVDSGGQGLVYIFEGMLRYVHGEMNGLNLTAVSSNNIGPAHTISAQELAMPDGGEIENPYDVQFILMGENLNVTEVRNRIDAMGDSTVVVGDETTIKVHIHVEDPGEPISYGISLGKITDIVVENMQMQMEEIVHAPAATAPPAPMPPTIKTTVQPGQIGVVAVAAGEGLAQIFRSMNASYVVNGGQTNNPSIEELFQAIQDVPTDKVVILPNNKNIILAAEAARDLSPKNVAVVPTKTAPQGLSAMLMLNPNGDLEETAVAMNNALQEVATGEITRATRTVTLDGVDVKEGEFIGLVDGRLCTSSPELTAVLDTVFTAMEMEDRELLSIYYGQDISKEEASALANQIEAQYEDIEIELLSGEQPYYFYILGAE
ncbi:MAG: DAK2 domain-containing protein [Chloroflexi bacterium]|nr:DAK2 domain-containing protein [Chloroflexota bacterium]